MGASTVFAPICILTGSVMLYIVVNNITFEIGFLTHSQDEKKLRKYDKLNKADVDSNGLTIWDFLNVHTVLMYYERISTQP